MHIAKLRQVGGSVMVAIPPSFLDQLHLAAQSSVGLVVEKDKLVIKPVNRRPIYTFAELAAQCDPNAPVDADPEWTSGSAIGDELI